MTAADTTPLWRRLAWALALVAVIVVGDRVMAAGLHAAVMHTGNRFAVIYRGDAPGGVLILGNSRGVNTFYQPAIEAALDRSVFNASFNGMSTEMSEVILEDYVARNPPPDLVLLEVTGLSAGANQVANFYPFASESDRLGALLDQAAPETATARRLFHLLNYNGEMLFRSLAAAGASDQDEINRYRISRGLLARTERMEPQPMVMLRENHAALARIATFCRERDIELRLVVGPYLPAYRDKLTGYDVWLAGVQRAAPGVRIWDYSRAVDDVTGFADRLHLNYRGAQLLTPVLIEDGLFDLGAPTDTTARS